MGSTADLAMVQKMIIDTLHKEGMSQRVFTEGGGGGGGGGAVQGVLHQSILNAKLTGRKKFGWKMCTSNRDDPKLENTVKQSRFKHLGHFQKHLTWAKEKNNWTVAQWSKDLFSDESKFCISFGNQGPGVWRKRGEAQNPCSLKSSVKFPQSVMIWAAMSSAGVGPLCFLKSTVNAAIYQEILEHIMLLSADKLYGDAGFIFQQDLAPAHTAKGTKSWFNDHGVTVLDWPANSPDLLSRGRWETPDPTMQMTWRPLSKKPGLPLHLSRATGWLEAWIYIIYGFHFLKWVTKYIDLFHDILFYLDVPLH